MHEFLTVNEVAGLLRVHRNTVIRWLDAGKFPESVSIGNTIRIPLSDIEALKQNKGA